MTGKLWSRGECNYDELEGVRISLLKELQNSPKHFRHRSTNPRPQTKSLSLGTAAHTAVLEPERFLLDYALWESTGPDGEQRQRRGKAWEDFKASNSKKTIITTAEYSAAVGMSRAVRADRIAMKYLACGRAEVAAQWTDTHTGQLCRGRVDWETEIDGQTWLVDLKTAADITPDTFARSCARYSYHLQAAYYVDGWEAATGVAPKYAIVAVESGDVADVAVYVVPEDVLDIGRDEYRRLLEVYRDCVARGRWPGVANGMELTLALPAWATPDDNDITALGLTA